MAIAKSWQEFSAMCLPENAPRIQRTEMQKAFYAGAYTSLMACLKACNSAMSEDKAAEIIADMVRECEAFAKGVGAGRG
jgi:ketopantoate reductase